MTVPSMTELMQPKFVLATKRGWGMLLMGASTAIPLINLVGMKYGWHVDGPMVDLVGTAVSGAIDAIGVAAGAILWVWGSFRPTAPLTLNPMQK